MYCHTPTYRERCDNFNKQFKAMQTQVKVKCVSKKESFSYNKENPIATAIELEVPYDQNSIYWKLSGGTNLTLNTINKQAADMFNLGDSYDMVISPSAVVAPD